MQMQTKQVKIPMTLFLKLFRYFYLDDVKLHNEISKELNDKFDSLVKHELYSKYKDKNLDEAEREKARQKYLDMIGVRDSFRW